MKRYQQRKLIDDDDDKSNIEYYNNYGDRRITSKSSRMSGRRKSRRRNPRRMAIKTMGYMMNIDSRKSPRRKSYRRRNKSFIKKSTKSLSMETLRFPIKRMRSRRRSTRKRIYRKKEQADFDDIDNRMNVLRSYYSSPIRRYSRRRRSPKRSYRIKKNLMKIKDESRLTKSELFAMYKMPVSMSQEKFFDEDDIEDQQILYRFGADRGRGRGRGRGRSRGRRKSRRIKSQSRRRRPSRISLRQKQLIDELMIPSNEILSMKRSFKIKRAKSALKRLSKRKSYRTRNRPKLKQKMHHITSKTLRSHSLKKSKSYYPSLEILNKKNEIKNVDKLTRTDEDKSKTKKIIVEEFKTHPTLKFTIDIHEEKPNDKMVPKKNLETVSKNKTIPEIMEKEAKKKYPSKENYQSGKQLYEIVEKNPSIKNGSEHTVTKTKSDTKVNSLLQESPNKFMVNHNDTEYQSNVKHYQNKKEESVTKSKLETLLKYPIQRKLTPFVPKVLEKHDLSANQKNFSDKHQQEQMVIIQKYPDLTPMNTYPYGKQLDWNEPESETKKEDFS